MNPMKRLGLTMLVLILGPLLATAPALADKPWKPLLVSSTYKLTVPVGALDPFGSGQLTLESFIDPPPACVWVTVSCKRLTPGKQYHVVCRGEWWQTDPSSGIRMEHSWWQSHSYTADNKGSLYGEFTVIDLSCEPWVGVSELWIEDDAGDVVLQWDY